MIAIARSRVLLSIGLVNSVAYLANSPRIFSALSSTLDKKGKRKGDAARFHACSFLGRPGGRSVKLSPSFFAVRSCQRSSPNGEPRFTLRRNAASSASVCGLFTCAAQSRDIGTGQAHKRSFGAQPFRR